MGVRQDLDDLDDLERRYRLYRKENTHSEWRSTARGDWNYISSLLKLNLESPELQDFEWKVAPVK